MVPLTDLGSTTVMEGFQRQLHRTENLRLDFQRERYQRTSLSLECKPVGKSDSLQA